METSNGVQSSPEVLAGTPVSAGTRVPVPVQTWLDYLKAGDSLDAFLENVPTVEREPAIAFREASARALPEQQA